MRKKKHELALIEAVESLILSLRGERVMLDADLARVYGVSTKRLNEQIKRNANRFPSDFVFRLTRKEKDEVVANCDHLKAIKFSKVLPLAFTEHGAIMAANVLSSRRAVEMSIHVIRAFITMRHESGRYAELARKLAELEHNQHLHGEDIQMILGALRELETTTNWAYPEGRRLIGFRADKPKREGE